VILDGPRPPSSFDPDASRYKDWLHLNIFEPASGLVALVNVGLHGAPGDRRARAVGTALAHLPKLGWVGNAEVRGLEEARLDERLISLPSVALGLDVSTGDVHAAAALASDRLTVKATARADAPVFAPRKRVAFGDGWMNWQVVPRLRVEGELRAHDRTVDLAGAVAYCDHNWGRWRWGDDAGWEWGCFAAADAAVVAVFKRITDRDHGRRHDSHLFVQRGSRRHAFAGASLRLDRAGSLRAPVRRLPGALAALHGDRARPGLPAEVALEACDGRDVLRLHFTAQAAAQLVVAEVTEPGYGFIHEIAGTFTLEGRLGRDEIRTGGLGVFEHVD
jgi:hypothetical protein